MNFHSNTTRYDMKYVISECYITRTNGAHMCTDLNRKISVPLAVRDIIFIARYL